MSQSKPPSGKGAPVKTETPAATEQSPAPRDAARGVKEEIVYLNLSELHPFKNHPFGVRDDAEMQGLVESVKAAGVNQPALVRPREGGGYEIIARHRRQRASELAGFVNMPCILSFPDPESLFPTHLHSVPTQPEAKPMQCRHIWRYLQGHIPKSEDIFTGGCIFSQEAARHHNSVIVLSYRGEEQPSIQPYDIGQGVQNGSAHCRTKQVFLEFVALSSPFWAFMQQIKP